VLATVRSATPGTAAGPEAAAPFGCGPWLFSHNGAAQRWRDWGEAAYLSWADPVHPPRAGAATARHDAPSAGTPSAGTPSAGTPPTLLSCLEALTDAALLWALTWQRLRAGLPLDAALAGTVAAVEAAGGTGRLNLLLTDGRSVAATAYGDTLWYRQTPAGPGSEGSPPVTAAGSGREGSTPVTAAGPGREGSTPVTAARPGRNGSASVTVASEPDDDGPGWTEVPDRHMLTATPSRVRVRPLSDLPAGPPAGAPPPTAAHPPASGHPQATIRPQATTSAPKGS
jgi:glutamine amidotransferase